MNSEKLKELIVHLGSHPREQHAEAARLDASIAKNLEALGYGA